MPLVQSNITKVGVCVEHVLVVFGYICLSCLIPCINVDVAIIIAANVKLYDFLKKKGPEHTI